MSVGSRGNVGRFTAPCTSIQFLCLIFLVSCPIFVDKCTTHPLSGGGQEKDGCPLPSRSARHPPPKWGWARKRWTPPSVSLRSPPTPLSGGGQEKDGCPLPSRSARHPPPKWGWARKHGCPLPSRSARHPPPPKWGWARKTWMPPSVSLRSPPTPLSGGGQEKDGGEGRLTQTLASPCLQGEGDRVSTSNLASPRSRGGGGPRSGGRGVP